MTVKRQRKGKKTSKLSLREEIVATQRDIGDKFVVIELERRCLKVEKEYADLRARLVNLLLPEQIDAAKICGVTPEMYALEWIDIFYKDKLREHAPSFYNPLKG